MSMILSPSEMHRRAEVADQKVPVEQLPVYQTVTRIMQNDQGISRVPMNIMGTETKEYLAVYFSDLTSYTNGLRVAEAIYNAGYFVAIYNSAVPRNIRNVSAPVYMVISWDPVLVATRIPPDPCWSCKKSLGEKQECMGCNENTVWRADLKASWKTPVSGGYYESRRHIAKPAESKPGSEATAPTGEDAQQVEDPRVEQDIPVEDVSSEEVVVAECSDEKEGHASSTLSPENLQRLKEYHDKLVRESEQQSQPDTQE